VIKVGEVVLERKKERQKKRKERMWWGKLAALSPAFLC